MDDIYHVGRSGPYGDACTDLGVAILGQSLMSMNALFQTAFVGCLFVI